MKVLVVGGKKLFVDALIYFLKSKLEADVVDWIKTESLERLPDAVKNTDVILFDMESFSLQQLELIRQVRTKQHLIAITDYTEEAYTKDIIRLGFKTNIPRNTIYSKLPSVLNQLKN